MYTHLVFRGSITYAPWVGTINVQYYEVNKVKLHTSRHGDSELGHSFGCVGHRSLLASLPAGRGLIETAI